MLCEDSLRDAGRKQGDQLKKLLQRCRRKKTVARSKGRAGGGEKRSEPGLQVDVIQCAGWLDR